MALVREIRGLDYGYNIFDEDNNDRWFEAVVDVGVFRGSSRRRRSCPPCLTNDVCNICIFATQQRLHCHRFDSLLPIEHSNYLNLHRILGDTYIIE